MSQEFEASATNPTMLGGAAAPDYSTATMEGRQTHDVVLERKAHFDAPQYIETTERFDPSTDTGNDGRRRNSSSVSPGGVGVDHLPVGKANIIDKVYGKTEKVFGKLMKNPDMHETGELRSTGGRKAAIGEARRPDA